MNSTFLNQDEFAKQWTSNLDLVSEKILQLFFYTKFFPIFSLLFGLGMAMQALKLKERNQISFSFFARRMFILFIIGVFHILFLWSGDVLNLYALLGLLVMPLFYRSNKMLLVLSCFFLLFPFYDQLFSLFYGLLNYHPGSYLKNYDAAEVNRIISSGTYLEGIKLRISEYLENIPMLFGFLGPIALSMFILGIYLGKNKVYESLDVFIRKIKTPMLILTILTNIYRVVFLFILPKYPFYQDESIRPYLIKLMVISDVFMGLFYLWIIGWLWYHTKFRIVLNPLKYIGRMALTNYMMQSFIGLILFSSIGLALYETMSPSETLLTALVVCCFQLIFSRIWLIFFKYGFLEWIWRCFTYQQVLPIKRS